MAGAPCGDLPLQAFHVPSIKGLITVCVDALLMCCSIIRGEKPASVSSENSLTI
ncbi:hypothetical protein BRADI_4g05882v3 [Brachypodium distachyon]|uniref:Uncharacterized protein n=1 Tax=Brachypodium distachyon TaxID=15368 RepID=A0A2K2CKR1_BRADI|nr:hypothetical protein BRADI_4g05882v3 [Brachypodium distachyon]